MTAFTRDQTNFSTGELDPKVQSRTDWTGFYTGAKKLRDALAIPQGGVTSRWGTKYVDTATVVQNNFLYCEISTLVYDGTATYLLVWEALSLKIYLENNLLATVVTTFAQEDIQNLRFCQVQNRLIITNPYFRQKQLARSASAANLITGFDGPNNGLVLTNNLTVDYVYPVTFTTTLTLPVTNPQIYTSRTYYIKPYIANSVKIFSTPEDAAAGTNEYTVTSAGTGVNNVIVQNTWTLSDITFINIPSYDFDGGYSAITFTPSATSGNITLTASANIFTAAMVGGLYTGNGGSLRITGFTNATTVTGFTVLSFPNTNAIQGSLSFLGEPVWSAARGYPRACGFFQQRLYFGGTPIVSNGVWGSVVNDVFNFDDSETLADNAISYYPADGDEINIQSMTSGQTLIVHTNHGSYSTPYGGIEVPLTPTNFVLTQKSPFGVSNIQPVFIDNQIIFVDSSGNNVINLVWQIDQGSFVTNNISVYSDSLIINPTDMASLAQPNATNGFYVLFVNEDGTLAVFQTLFEQGVASWSLMSLKTWIPNNIAPFPVPPASDFTLNPISIDSSFIRVTTALNRCWFTISRFVPIQRAPVNITGFSSITNTLTAVAHGMSQTEGTLITFSGVVPTTNPQITNTNWFWGRGITNDTFAIYSSKTNADTNANRFQIINYSGMGAQLISWPITEKLYIEELTFDFKTDSSKGYTFSTPATTLTGLSHLNGLAVRVNYNNTFINGLQYLIPFNGQLALFNIGVIDTASVGLRYTPTLSPLPVTVPQVEGLLYKNKHIRKLYIRYFQSQGLQLNGIDFPDIAVPNNGVIELSDGVYAANPMQAWEAIDYDLEITQPNSLPMTIIALSYIIEV